MTSISDLLRPDKGGAAIALELVDKARFESWLNAQPERVRQAVRAQGFRGEGFQIATVPGERNDSWFAVLGVADVESLSPWCLAKAAETLPEGTYRVPGRGPGPAVLGWLLGQYVFDRYKKPDPPRAPKVLLTDEPARIDETVLVAEAVTMVRDLVNLPTSDCGPRDLEEAVARVASECGARFAAIAGDPLEEGYPMVAAVGRGAAQDRAPRLLELTWGKPDHPRLALVGKGVCFDSGGLDIKPSSAMRLMKKDMGGGAHALALARLIMRHQLPVRLHLLIPAVENAVSGASFRPGDVLRSRKGLTVEVGNTDAEGRLVLGDALARAGEEKPELIIDFATLTGAARVALGPDLPALFANRDELAERLVAHGDAISDPLWRMPLWSGYGEMLASDVADLGNVSEAPMAGAVIAALFLQRFVPEDCAWMHLDTYAWRAAAKPGRPKGGDALGLRATWQLVKERYGSSGAA